MYWPLDTPINATPAAEPTLSMLPPTPQVRVISSHWPWSIGGLIRSTAYMIGMLSTIADSAPIATLAQVCPSVPYSPVEASSMKPIAASPPTHISTP